jgi:hypothetical protein
MPENVTAPIQAATENVTEAVAQVGDVAANAPTEIVKDGAESIQSVLSSVATQLGRLNDYNDRTQAKEAAAAAAPPPPEVPVVKVAKAPPEKKRGFGRRRK